jgi:hypothetical protein
MNGDCPKKRGKAKQGRKESVMYASHTAKIFKNRSFNLFAAPGRLSDILCSYA